ncbi:uncharacterized protein LOC6565614 [Drosophila grimshawi]|uniref:GH24306 n=1 Tax=Drosophila grimshawi TaxID=7222 RepID=B4JML1_DROGR|nr:uncharacterized protein LOC6565614 [Drosophila grimshawi]EDV91954.1 GH24306 [Drosophila grimshawi]
MGDILEPKPVAETTKLKRDSALGAIADIQRLSPEAIGHEFDRLAEHTQRHLVYDTHMPCLDVEELLMRCLRQHHQESFKCFKLMDHYQKCVSLATQDHIDQLAEYDEQLDQMTPLPVVPPQSMQPQSVKEPSRRSWFKPWTWLR